MILFKKLRCKHPNSMFVQNYSQEDIEHFQQERSVWKCLDCGEYYGKNALYYRDSVVCVRVYINSNDIDAYWKGKRVACSRKKSKRFNIGIYPEKSKLEYMDENKPYYIKERKEI